MTTLTANEARLANMTAEERAIERVAEAQARAEAGGYTLFGTLVTEAAFWAESGIHTGLDLDRSLAIGDVSDSYKEAYNVRPRFYNFDAMTLAEIEAEAERLHAEAKAAWEAEQAEEAAWEAQKAAEKAQADEDASWRPTEALWAMQDEMEGVRCRW